MRDRLRKIPYGVYKMMFNVYAAELPEKFNQSKTKWNDNGLNVIVIRCNDIYVTNDMERNNDWLILFFEGKEYIFQCTADPKYRRNKIANICEQVYFGNIRSHNFVFGRDAICQDNCKVFVRRYINKEWYEESGYFHINIHNANGFFNSSLGCVILADEKRFISTFRPLLREAKKVSNKIPVAVLNIEWLEMKAEAYNGHDKTINPEAKEGIIT